MNAALQLRQSIEGEEIQHTRFAEAMKLIFDVIDDALYGFQPTIQRVLAPSRSGKSALIAAIERRHPKRREEGRRVVPVLVVRITAGTSAKWLSKSILQELGFTPRPRDTTGELDKFLDEQLRVLDVRVIVFEEVNHLIEDGARVQPRDAADWFKERSDLGKISMILFGIPKMEGLFTANEQFRLRASSPIELRPYLWSVPEDWTAFCQYVATYVERFARSPWPIEMELESLACHCYLISGGVTGVVTMLMISLSKDVRNLAPRPLTFEDFAKAATRVESCGSPSFPAFCKLEVTPLELAAAYSCVIAANDMSMRSKA